MTELAELLFYLYIIYNRHTASMLQLQYWFRSKQGAHSIQQLSRVVKWCSYRVGLQSASDASGKMMMSAVPINVKHAGLTVKKLANIE